MREILQILCGPLPMGRLDLAALEIASIEHPDLDAGHWAGVLDGHAAELGRRVPMDAPGDCFIDAANRYLFEDLGLTGNAANYYDPRNSCLNDVLTSRTGIPITLSVLYMEIGRRLARPVYGVGLPGHFLVQYDDGEISVYLDPFHAGARRTPEQCFTLARESTGAPVPSDPKLLAPVTHRAILVRMLNNLRTAYFHRRSYRRALRVLDLLLEAFPGSPDEYKQRGTVHAHLHRFGAARADFARYLELAPGAPDREDVERRIHSLQQRLAALN